MTGMRCKLNKFLVFLTNKINQKIIETICTEIRVNIRVFFYFDGIQNRINDAIN
jgi:hypothetical protein